MPANRLSYHRGYDPPLQCCADAAAIAPSWLWTAPTSMHRAPVEAAHTLTHALRRYSWQTH